MNGIGMGFNPAAFSRASMGPTQAQQTSQAANGGGSLFAKDAVEKNRKNKEMAKLVNPKIASKKIVQKAKKVGGKAKAG